MAVEDAAHLVGDRLVHVAAGDQHGVERGDRAARVRPGPLEQPRQQREHAGRIALARGRLAGGQPDLALRARDARDRVEHEQHAPALVAEALGDRRSRRTPPSAAPGWARRWSRTRRPSAPARPAPSDSSRNSTTSRPRSPTSAMTFTSASVWRAICPSSVDLPTPEPAKSPTRWPSPTVSSASSTRTPSGSGRLTRGRDSGSGAGRSTAHSRASAIGPAPSIGLAEPVEHAPEQAIRHARSRTGGRSASPANRGRRRPPRRAASAPSRRRGSRRPRRAAAARRRDALGATRC